MRKISTRVLSLALCGAAAATLFAVPQLTQKSAPQREDAVVLTPPFDYSFQEKGFDGWTSLDANNDGISWVLSESYYGNNIYSAVKDYGGTPVDMDDWFFSPAITLEKNKEYTVSITGYGYDENEKLDIMLGEAANPESMTVEVAKGVALPTKNYGDPNPVISYSFVSPADGNYHLGVKNGTLQHTDYVYIYSIAFSAGESANGPLGVSNLKATPGANGAKEITLSFKAPETNKAGEALTAIDSIVVDRGISRVKKFENPAVGAELSFTDQPDASGDYTYTVKAYVGKDASAAATVSAYCGHHAPNTPANVYAKENDTFGNVTVSWEAVTTDTEGLEFGEGDVKYNVYYQNAEGQLVTAGENLTETECTFQLTEGDAQAFLTCFVEAVCDNLYSNSIYAPEIVVGKPYTKFHESFAGGQMTYAWQVPSGGYYTYYQMMTDSDKPYSYDGDGGFLGCIQFYADPKFTMTSGKVSLEGLKAPVLKMNAYNNGNNNGFTLYVRELDGEWQEVGTCTIDGSVNKGSWSEFSYNLADFKDKVVQFKLDYVKVTPTLYIDNLTIIEPKDYDLKAVVATAPAEVNAGSKFTANFQVENKGSKAAADYSIVVKQDDKVVATVEGTELAAGEKTELAAEIEMSEIATGSISYSAELVWDADEDMDNNEFKPFAVTVLGNKAPKVTDLQGVYEEVDGQKNVKLTWTAPDVTTIMDEPYTESFEDGEFGATTYGDWTFIDGDKESLKVGSIFDISLPSGTDPIPFFVFDHNPNCSWVKWEAHTGSKAIGTLPSATANNDWAITPKLTGDAQTVSLFVKNAYNNYYKESVRFLYTTEDIDPENFDESKFIELQSVASLPTTYTEYSFNLPEGAKYFAINCNSTGAHYGMAVDDVTYMVKGQPWGKEPVGYNIFRDGEKINDTPVTELAYTDEDVDAGYHDYVVTAVYDDVVSGASNNARVEVLGFPTVLDLKATPGDGMDVILTWSAPELGNEDENGARALDDNSSLKDLQIMSYDIHRDGAKITETPVAHVAGQKTYTYTDKRTEKTHIYNMTVNYANGTSDKSEDVIFIFTGIDGVNGALKVSTATGMIEISNAGEAEVAIIAADGKLIYNGRGDASVNVAAGIYMVKVANKTVKLIVK